MKEIPLTQGKVAIVDDEDFDRINLYKWRYCKGAAQSQTERPNRKVLLMHRMILNAPDGVEVDHINGDALDNRKSNLRLASHKQNLANQKMKASNTSGFKGVTWHSKNKRWIAQIQGGHYLGSYATAEDAARAYDKKAKELFGEFARLNF